MKSHPAGGPIWAEGSGRIGDVNPRTAATAFRIVAVAEALSWIGLLIGMYVKYVPQTTELGVHIFGPLHGGVFLASVGVAVPAAPAGGSSCPPVPAPCAPAGPCAGPGAGRSWPWCAGSRHWPPCGSSAS